jgi:hypothetical protein
VFARDLREAAEVGGGANRVGDYELHDLIMIELVPFDRLYNDLAAEICSTTIAPKRPV